MTPPQAADSAKPRKRGRPPDTDAAYRILASQLNQRLQAGEWPTGSPFPPLRTLAKEYKVGYRKIWMAVEALKKEGRLQSSSGGRLVVRAESANGASVLNPVLQVFAYGNLRLVARAGMARDLHRGIMAGLGDIEASVLTVHQTQLEKQLPVGFGEQRFSGILLMGHFRQNLLRIYEKLLIPTVLLDYPHPSWKGHAVSVDNVGAAKEATLRLINMGHRRLAFLRFVSFHQRDVDIDAKERAQGFLEALNEAGLKPRRNVVFNSTPRDKPDTPVLQRILRAHPQFTAVVASGISQAKLMMKAAEAAGKSVPKDISVVSFQEQPPNHSEISGARFNFETMGSQAVKLLKQPRSVPQHIRIPGVWKEGHTVMPPKPKKG